MISTASVEKTQSQDLGPQGPLRSPRPAVPDTDSEVAEGLEQALTRVAEFPIEPETIVEARKGHVRVPGPRTDADSQGLAGARAMAIEVPVVQSQERRREPGPWRDAFCFSPEVDASPPRGVSAPDAAAPDAKKPRPGGDAEPLAKMFVNGITRVLQNRIKEAKGPLPIANLGEEFKALCKVPLHLQQAGETDAVTFLQKWPNKFEVVHDGTQHLVQLAKKAAEQAKLGVPSLT